MRWPTAIRPQYGGRATRSRNRPTHERPPVNARVQPADERSLRKSSHGARPAGVWLCALGLLLIAVIPILINRHPPLLDYPWHLARVSTLAQWEDSAFAQAHYQLSSVFLPNLGFELVMVPLLEVLTPVVATDVYLILCFALTLAGTVWLHRMLHGGWSYWPLVAALFLYNWILLFGFLGYLLGVGLFLCCSAGWLALGERPWWLRLLIGIVFSVALFFAHMIALGLYAVAIGGFELQRAAALWRRSPPTAIGLLAVGAGQFIPPLAMFVAQSPTKAVVGGTWLYKPFEKLASPIVTLTAGDPALDLVTAAGLAIAAVLILLFGRVRLARAAWLALTSLILAFLLLPHAMNWVGLVDVRVPMALLFFVIAALRVELTRRAATQVFIVALLAVFAVRVSATGYQWVQFDRLVGAYLRAFEALAPESTLFTARQALPHSWARRIYVDRLTYPPQVGALASVERPILSTTGFIEEGHQPIRLRDRFGPLKAYQDEAPMDVADEAGLLEIVAETAELQRSAAPERSAYLLLVDRGLPELQLPAHVEVIADGPGFRLIRTYRPG